MRSPEACIAILLLVLIPWQTGAREAAASWDNRCEECHGDYVEFAGKYLWNIEGQLQGQHHIKNLELFMRNHYIPDHEIESIRDMLLAKANSPVRFKTECGGCHGDAAKFVEKSIWVRGNGITGMESGKDVGDIFTDPSGTAGRRCNFLYEVICSYSREAHAVIM